ncbi:MAG: baseplate J/gp47 family protein, partial [Oscillospiraceae bacterium]|nr:baseplate J/gp47 family protein [Oscillospiraceae bacterium]
TFKWEYYSDIGWEALNCIDNTKNLTKSGLFIINSAVNICRKHLFGNDMFWLRAEKCNRNSDKFDIPIISNIYINTFKVINSNSKNSTDEYTDGYNVGKSGNIPKNSKISVDKSFGTAVQAFNHFAMFGGNDCENTEEAVKRISAQLKHKDRCVVAEDYNLLIKNFEKNICKTKIINASNNITIFILIEEFTPEYFESIKNSLMTFLKEKMPLGIKINVLPPIFTEYHIQADIISDYNFSDFDIKESILNAIKEFINPVYGNFDGKGWSIGVLPNENQIISIVKNVKNVIALKDFHIKFYQNNEEINYHDISDNSVAVFSDKCSIKILHTTSDNNTNSR